jgi:hypothetical protein
MNLQYRTRVLALLVGFLSIFAYASAQSSLPVVVPSILPPSPEATALGKYGDLPVGMFTGTPNFSIDLYKISTKHLSLPITLNYSSNGIKVDEVSSKVGMSWTLNCGGMISRTVYSQPDFYEIITAPGPPDQNFSNVNTDTALADWMQAVGTSNVDFQMDAFNYNFNGYSGKFFISPSTGLPLIAPYTNLKIQYSVSGTNLSFIITTPDGVMYYFGGAGATEYTEDFSTCTGSSHSGTIPTAWYLTKIQSPLDPSDSLHFSYNPTSCEYATGLNETVTYIDATSLSQYQDCANSGECTCGPTPYIYGEATPSNGQGTPQICQSVSGIQGLCLSQITDGKYNLIQFANILKPDVNYDSLVSSISVYNNQTGAKIKSYNFTYTQAAPNFTGSSTIYSVSTARPFLTEVDELDNTGTVIRPWKLSYTDFSGLPPRLSYSQDYWGYFNGVINPSMIPLPSLGYSSIASNLIANRNPDYNSAGLGMLKQITYPTGGYTQIEYEGNTLDSTYTIQKQDTSITYLSGIQAIDVSTTGTDPHYATFTVLKQANVTITETLSCGSGSCPTMSNSAYWGELVLNGTDILQATYERYNERQEEVETVVTMTLQPGTYGLDVLPNGGYSMDLNLQPSTTSDSIYIENIADQVPLTTALYATSGGMRVKRTVSYDPVANDSVVKRYYYDQAIFPSAPTYYNHLYHYESYWFTGGDGPCEPVLNSNIGAGYNEFFSSSLTNLYGAGNSTVYYTQVRESLGDNFQNGGILHKFSANTFVPVQFVWGQGIPNVTAPNLNWQNGLETYTENFKVVNGVDVPVQTQTMSYTIDPRNSDTLNQFFIQQIGNNSGHSQGPGAISQDFNVAEINYITQWQYLNNKITQDYDQNGNPTVADTINYYYDNPVHAQLTRTETTDSKGQNEQNIWRYPQDAASFNLPSSGEGTALSSLISQGRTATLIEQETDRNGALAKLIHNTYENTPYGSTLPLNINLQNGNGPPYTDYTISNYDQTGNILQIVPKEGVSQYYIWDYRGTLPIAKVINAAPADIGYTSFEADGSGNWYLSGGTVDTTQAITGRSSYENGTVSFVGLTPATTYIVSYWSQNGAYSIPGTISGYPVQGKTISYHTPGWTLYVHKITGQSSISFNVNGHIDELRIYPSTAQMTTYTYAPLVGMTSQMDVGNRGTYFAYDGLQRLKRVRDQDYNILKTITYAYQAPAGCGSGCYSIAMQTWAGTNTLSYPVGVFDVNGNKIDTASNAARYVTVWNSDTADQRVGTLSQGSDSMHFNIAVNTGQTLPASVTGLRYFQVDLPWNQFDGVRQFNGAYIDFGDGAGIRMPSIEEDTPAVHPPNTVYYASFDPDYYHEPLYYFVHYYPDTSLKTITFYHNDTTENSDLDNELSPATSLTLLRNLRGYLPAHTDGIGGSSYQQPSMYNLQGILNWSQISSVTHFRLNNGDSGPSPNKNIAYPQDFMANNKGLTIILTDWGGGIGNGDTTFKLSRLKSDWNTYFTQLLAIDISDRDWNHEDLTALTNLRSLELFPNDANGGVLQSGPWIPIDSTVIDNLLMQISAGAGQSVKNGFIGILTGGSGRSSASQAAVNQLNSMGWVISIDGVVQVSQ